MCPQKLAPRAPLKSIEDAPRRVAVMCVTDADGFKTVPPRRSGQRLGDFIASTPAPRCNSNRFRLLSLEDWQEVAATAADAPEILSSEAFRMPNLTSNICFPTLSRSAAPSSALSTSPTAPSSGQGEVIAGDARSKVSCFSRIAVQSQHMLPNVVGRRVELNLEEPEVDHIHSRLGHNCNKCRKRRLQ